MDVSRETFPFELVNIIQAIVDSHFVAFDLEFSGIATRRRAGQGGRRSSLQQVYQETKIAAQQYQVLQFGLTIVEEDLENGENFVLEQHFPSSLRNSNSELL